MLSTPRIQAPVDSAAAVNCHVDEERKTENLLNALEDCHMGEREEQVQGDSHVFWHGLLFSIGSSRLTKLWALGDAEVKL